LRGIGVFSARVLGIKAFKNTTGWPYGWLAKKETLA
jgi:hypothetical protein